MDNLTFKRCEMKYLITKEQYEKMKLAMDEFMKLDNFGKHTVHSIYMDTDDYLLIRRSIEKPCYKEKLRIRGYNSVSAGDKVFIELKKKFKGTVYKRRTAMTQKGAMDYVAGKAEAEIHNQIVNEIDYFLDFYGNLHPAMMISCDREAYFCKAGTDLRITFDQNVLARDYDLDISKGGYGHEILGGNFVLLEVKTSLGLPMWLLDFFSENEIFKTSFSKYGTAYKMLLFPQINELGGITHVA